ncbi:hypothetical protein [Paenibacillus violae]|uniref:hypothetical protein n=1 Tax=Paenibacillus violae TaxID=3077234 RepID=UPI0028FC1E9E|nr:hypothetical protein [Paenibacillus sp. PFR10]
MMRYYRSDVLRQQLNILTYHQVTQVERYFDHFRVYCCNHHGQDPKPDDGRLHGLDIAKSLAALRT